MRLQSHKEITRLRQRLCEMTESGCQPHEHPTMLMQISRELPNTIRVRESDRAPQSFTCGMHTFGFESCPEYAEVAAQGVFAGLQFFTWLTATGRLVEVDDHQPSENDLVMYFDGGKAVHVGRVVSSGRVISKWGVGLMYEHGLSEVPKNYGDEVRFFRSIEPDVALEHFLDFAEERGG
jgi:hypothetical protein